MSSTTIRIGLVGCGVVGNGALDILQAHAATIEKRLGARLVVEQIAVRDPNRARTELVPPTLLTYDPLEVARNPNVDIVVEVMGGVDLAEKLVREALERGKHVVTANKALLAEKGDALFDLAKQKGLDLYFEAAVAGGIPIIRALEQSLASDEIISIQGIINGTSNYILTEMTERGLDFAVALESAQREGYAEEDPILDINGGDAAHKLAILATLAFGVRVHTAHILTDGIDVVDAQDIAYAKGFDYVIRPMAVATRTADHVLDLRVHPALVSNENPLAHITGALNAVMVHGERVGNCLLSGPGAGAGPTATSVVSDVIDIGRNMLKNASGRVPSFIHDENAEPIIQDPNDLVACHYLRFKVRDEPGVLSKITGKLGDCGISIEKMFQDAEKGAEGAATVVIVTHAGREGDLRRALSELDPMPHTLAPARLLRILS